MSDTIAVQALYAELGLPNGPVIVDVRTERDYAALPRLIPGAMRGEPTRLETWRTELSHTRRIVVYCARGGQVSRDVAETLIAAGFPATRLDGGLEGWIEAGHATTRARPELSVPGHS